MPYNNNIPQPQDIIANSQTDLITDFQEIANVFAINHRAINDANEGIHRFLQLPEQGAVPTTLVNEAALYAAQGTLVPRTELLFRRESDGDTIAFTEGIQIDQKRQALKKAVQQVKNLIAQEGLMDQLKRIRGLEEQLNQSLTEDLESMDDWASSLAKILLIITKRR